MNVGKTLYVKNRQEWRRWLAKNGKTATEIWLIYYKKASGKPRIPLTKSRRMTKAGLAAIDHTGQGRSKLPDDILERLKADPTTWKNFQKFPSSYKRIRVGWIDAARHRREVFVQRLRYFLKMTAQNKRFGMVQ